MDKQIELSAVVKSDGKGNEYYVVSPETQETVDLSKVTILVFHPNRKGGRATIILKPSSRAESPVASMSQEEKLDAFVEELANAEDRYVNGYVNAKYFLTRWYSPLLPASSDERRKLADELVKSGDVEFYKAPDGREAIRLVEDDD